MMVLLGAFTLPAAFAESATAGWAVAGTLATIGALIGWFSRLAVTVERGKLSASFGPGWPRKAIDLADVASVTAVCNTWIQGWGIRKIKGGWMYNVWGLDAVEFEMTSGDIGRIGTNDLDNFLAAVEVYTG